MLEHPINSISYFLLIFSWPRCSPATFCETQYLRRILLCHLFIQNTARRCFRVILPQLLGRLKLFDVLQLKKRQLKLDTLSNHQFQNSMLPLKISPDMDFLIATSESRRENIYGSQRRLLPSRWSCSNLNDNDSTMIGWSMRCVVRCLNVFEITARFAWKQDVLRTAALDFRRQKSLVALFRVLG